MSRATLVTKVVLVFVAAFAGGCCTRPVTRDTPSQAAVVLAPPPVYAEFAARYNVRCADLDRLKAPVSLTIESPDDKGGRRKDQVEAYLQLIQPSKVSLRIDKVGQVLAILGSDDERYWWIDLSNEPSALVGLHAKATPAAAAQFGVPVHPLDLIDVLGIRALPADGATCARAIDGLVEITLPARAAGWGRTRLFVDEATATPSRIEVEDAAGVVAVRAVLSMYVPVKVSGNTFSPARIASRITMELPAQGVKVSVGVASPENPGEEMRTKPFDLPTLLRAYGVETPVNVDAGGGS